MSNTPTKYGRGQNPASLNNLKPWKPGQVANPEGRRGEKQIDGVPVSKFFAENLGPAAMKVAEKVLLHAATKKPQDITRLEVDMTQFMINRVYGKAEERIIMDTTVTEASNPLAALPFDKLEELERIMNSVTVEHTVIDDSKND